MDGLIKLGWRRHRHSNITGKLASFNIFSDPAKAKQLSRYALGSNYLAEIEYSFQNQ